MQTQVLVAVKILRGGQVSSEDCGRRGVPGEVLATLSSWFFMHPGISLLSETPGASVYSVK